MPMIPDLHIFEPWKVFLQGIFNYITTGAFTPVGPLLAPV
jgi:hypothetical protein